MWGCFDYQWCGRGYSMLESCGEISRARSNTQDISRVLEFKSFWGSIPWGLCLEGEVLMRKSWHEMEMWGVPSRVREDSSLTGGESLSACVKTVFGAGRFSSTGSQNILSEIKKIYIFFFFNFH
jgi:hypothetical protein